MQWKAAKNDSSSDVSNMRRDHSGQNEWWTMEHNPVYSMNTMCNIQKNMKKPEGWIDPDCAKYKLLSIISSSMLRHMRDIENPLLQNGQKKANNWQTGQSLRPKEGDKWETLGKMEKVWKSDRETGKIWKACVCFGEVKILS